jgi:UDP-N-acetylmuramate--alanine ligase
LISHEMLRKYQHIHFVGIGGIGMSGIAEVLLNLGFKVTGSDLSSSSITERLAKLGAHVSIGHKQENVAGADVVVISSAVKNDNCELQAATQQGIPVIPRAEMLAELMRMKFSIAVAGSHGKTTTTSMLAVILDRAGLDPTIVLGGRLDTLGSNARLGKGEFLVAEADESDRSFLKLFPTIAIVTNIDREHLDCYHDLEDIQKAFIDFANKVPFYGTAILCLDEPNIQSILPRIKRKRMTYGLSNQADLTAYDIELDAFKAKFTAAFAGERLGEVNLQVPGIHTIYNSLAAIEASLDIGIEFPLIKKALEEFKGADRRMQKKGEIDGILVIDDYGHHPTEIQATLSALRKGWNRRIIAVFQPHRYTRTKFLHQDFGRSFYDSDIVIVTGIYAAGENPINGIKGELIADEIKAFGHKNVIFIENLADIASKLLEIVKQGDIVLTLGAGNIWQAGETFLKLLRESKK